jgi:hypothetical protein
VIPFFPGFKNQPLKILRRLLPVGSLADEPGYVICPDGKDIKDHIILIKGEGGIAGIKDPQQPLGKGEYPEHLISAVLRTIPPSPPEIVRAAGQTSSMLGTRTGGLKGGLQR